MHALELLFVIALVLYSVAIWGHRILNVLSSWILLIFGIALLADVSGTVLLCVIAADGWQWNLHTVTGFASLIIMTLHFFWALSAVHGTDRWRGYFHRYSVLAWCLWCVSFVSGVPR